MTSIPFIYPDPETRDVCDRVRQLVTDAGGSAVFVGGCVRDAVLGRTSKDIDIEVYGIEPDTLENVLRSEFPLSLVGEAFGVIKLHTSPVDVSLPRRESKAGLGHKGFHVAADPTMSFQEAAKRRDYTVNAMGWDPATGQLLDHYGGRADLEARILRHTSDQFGEDPLRVLRGMQFVARFELTPAPETITMCRRLDLEGLAGERMFEEWRKLILQGVRPSLGLEFLRETMWLRFFPELEALTCCPQEERWHPEGDVWTHTLHCMDAFAEDRVGDDWEDLVVGLAVLCHDFGKPATTERDGDPVRSPGHESAGEQPTRSFLGRLTADRDLITQVVPLVQCHMRVHELHQNRAGDAAIRRLARKVGRIDRVVRVDLADRKGRPPHAPDDSPAGVWLLGRARALDVESTAPEPLVLGRHLIELGLEPGPHFGGILDQCYEAQLDGTFADLEGGLAFARALVQERNGGC
jgi:tRNA nucleotidyltransferase (CCA-adding enzyme)